MSISTDQAIATEVRAELAAKRVRGADLATALQLSPGAASMRVNGHVAMTVGELTAVAELLETTVDELIARARARKERDAS